MKTYTKLLLQILLALCVQVSHASILLPEVPAKDDFGYTKAPDESSASAYPVGSTEITVDASPMGAATFNIPLTVADGHGQMQPALSITYNSLAGNGTVGFGCNISGLSTIQRVPGDIYHDGKASRLVHGAADKYTIDGKRLMLASGTQGLVGSKYRPEDAPLSEVSLLSGANGGYFSVKTADGLTMTYGNSPTARREYQSPSANARICDTWYISRMEDASGNYVEYKYMEDNHHVYVSEITYGKNKNAAANNAANTVSFAYEARPDAQEFRLENVVGKMGLRLKSVTTDVRGTVLRKYTFNYDDTSDRTTSKFSRLVSVVEENGAGEQLKPTRINWNHLPSHAMKAAVPDLQLSSSVVLHKQSQAFMSADLNGDGISDLIEICPAVYGASEQSGTFDNYCYIYHSSINADGSIKFSDVKEIRLGASISWDDWSEMQGSPMVADITGDGIAELILPNMTVIDELGVKKANFQFVCGNRGGGSRNMNSFNCQMKKSKEFPVYTADDFDNDGKAEIIVVEREPVSGKSYNLIRIYHTSGYSLSHTESSISLPAKPEALFSADFNNDGLNDILFLHANGYKLFFNRGDTYKFNDADAVEGTTLKNSVRVMPGDFNGDGTPDFITFDAGSFKFALGQGDGTFTTVNIGKISDISSHDKDDERFSLSVFDFDHDGKTDVIVNAVQGNAKTYWLRSTGKGLTLAKSSSSKRKDDALSRYYAVGDFNGDGQAELLNYGYDCYNTTNADVEASLRFYTNISVADGKVKSVTDGYDNTVAVEYKTLAGGKAIYSPGSTESYPMVDVTLPLNVVSKITRTNGAVADEVTEYKYSGLKVHRQGKGLLGFSGMEVKNLLTGKSASTTINSWDRSFFIPVKVTSRLAVDGWTSSTVNVTGIKDKGNKVYFAYTSSSTSTDFDGDVSVTTYDYDTNNCRLSAKRTEHDDGYVYETTAYSSYVNKGGMWLPQIIDRFLQYDADTDMHESRTTIAYDDCGRKVSETKDAESSSPLVSTYTYDVYGNMLSSVTSGNGVAGVTAFNVYDEYGCNIVRKYTEPALTENTFTYDAKGNLLTETDATDSSHPITVTHDYDGWDRLVRTEHPAGKVNTTSFGWGTAKDKKYYVLEKGTGEPWVKTWYDAQGREVLEETVGPMDTNVTKKTGYAANGLPSSVRQCTGDLMVQEDFSYDKRGRLVIHQRTDRDKTEYTYGRRSVTATAGSGRTSTKTYNAWGDILSSTDSLNTVTWKYGALGLPVEAATCGSAVTIGYDDVGNRTSITDPDAGTATFAYDGLGRETSRTDARGMAVTTDYDEFGRVKSVTSDGQTRYNYGTSGTSKGRLTLMSKGFNAITISYTYDEYGRVLSKRHKINDEIFPVSYTYDANGAVKRAVFMGNVAVDYGYDCYGNLTDIIMDGDTVWHMKEYTGRVERHAWGNNIVHSTVLDATTGYLSGFTVEYDGMDLCYMTFEYDKQTGNLMSRGKMYDGSLERFTYDGLDRLTRTEYFSNLFIPTPASDNEESMADPLATDATPRPSVTFADNYTYADNGNIVFKGRIGAYTYSEEKPHAVTLVENKYDLIPRTQQDVSYNADGMVEIICDNDSNYRQDFLYGPDGNRCMSKLRRNATTMRTIINAGDYERVVEAGKPIREFFYIGGDVMYYREKGKGKVLYLVKDNIGNIISIIDAEGNSVFDASYDCWGKQTVKKNDISYTRGYTGHEMMPEFGLINMNGRLYDPLLGRFLSPDNYVQMPESSQSFNRYSYCLNNPLKYTDPSGDYAVVDDIFAALLGGFVNLGTNVLQGNIDGDLFSVLGKGFAAFGSGAVGGIGALYPEFGGWLWGGAIVGATNAWLSGEDGNGIMSGAVTGVFSSVLGGAIGEFITPSVSSFVFNNISVNSPLLKGMIMGMAGGAVGGGVGGFLMGFAMTGDFDQALDAASKGSINGLAEGAFIGGISAFRNARKANVSPWTGEKIEKHHSFQKALGGDDEQELTRMSKSRHRNLHKELNEHLRQQTNEDGKHMRPQRGNTNIDIKKNFTIEQRIEALKYFYDQHPIRYGDARWDFYKNTSMLKSWRPLNLKIKK